MRAATPSSACPSRDSPGIATKDPEGEMSEEDARAEAREQVESGGFVSAVAERIGSAAGVARVAVATP